MKLVNLTPHTVNVVGAEDKAVLSVSPSGNVARVTTKQVVIGSVAGVDVVRTEFGAVEGLPEPQDGVVYVVSTLVLQALKANGVARSDVVSPDTSPASVVRNADGQVVGVRRFQVL
ncbi:hypothetical protein [Geobacillus subterraneus]|uniref:Uncharacterized protein n=1 Tax=Geobacillus subterraneus TaxID=129338 RepID=A0A679FQZ8_9BACL|nr:hypothetical protein [Geobacillus subterraneus]BBW98988.1 hypothetical protein GsuE55_38210 [Geobacillus subterraneus]